MRRRRQHPEIVGAVARRVLKGAPASARERARPPPLDPRLAAAFARGAGETIAAHARPRFFRGGVLHLLVDSPTWLQELTFLRADLARKLSVALGREVREVKLTLERHPLPAPAGGTGAPFVPGPPAPFPSLSSEAQAAVEAAVAPLAEDPELQQAVARALSRWRARGTS